MRACCPASPRGNCCPSIRSNGCPGSPHAASMQAPAIPTSIGRRGISGEITNAPPIYSKDETPAPSSPASSSAGSQSKGTARRGSHIISFISPHPPFVVPAPYNTMYDPDDGPPSGERERTRRPSARSIPMSTTISPARTRRELRGRRQGQGRRSRTKPTFRQIRATYYGMISEVDAQLGACLGRREEAMAIGTTRSSSSPRTMPR